jgi:RimJ/RimL family protein N-acetyltransferase
VAALPLPAAPLTDGIVVLRPWREHDAAVVGSWGRDPEIVRWSGVPEDQSSDSARAYFRWAEQARQGGLSVALAIVDAGSEQVVGSCDVRRPDPADPAIGELGYLLIASARGRGLATRAVRLLTAWSFRELGMQRVQALVHPENPASGRVLDRLGFQREGLLRSYRAAPRGREDRVSYAVLPGELSGGAT